ARASPRSAFLKTPNSGVTNSRRAGLHFREQRAEVTHGIKTINRTAAAEFVRLLIIGATGGTGLQVTSQAVEGGHRVTAFVRAPQKLGSLRQRVVVREGDPRSVDLSELASMVSPMRRACVRKGTGA